MAAAAPSRTSPHLERYLEDYVDEHLETYGFPRDVTGIVNEYVMERPGVFGRAGWLEYLGQDVGNPRLPDKCVSWWNAPDAIDVFDGVADPRKNYETHLEPIWRPDIVSKQPYDLETLTNLVAHPLNGHPTTIHQGAEAYSQHKNTPAGPGCWLAVRKGVVARNLRYPEQVEYLDKVNAATGAGYERDNALLDLVTAVVIPHVLRGERHLGDDTGMERRWTFARSRDLVRYSHGSWPSVVGGFAPSGVNVSYLYDSVNEAGGVVALRKFSGH